MKKCKIEGDSPNQPGNQSAKKLATNKYPNVSLCGSFFSPKSLPWLLKILPLLSNLMPLKCLQISGIKMMLATIMDIPIVVLFWNSTKYQPREISRLIEIWKKIFHFLSRVSNPFSLTDTFSNFVLPIKFSYNYGLKIHHLIMSKIQHKSKQIILISTIILGFIYPLNVSANGALDKNQNLKNEIVRIIELEERRNGIPKGLLRSIAITESLMNPYILGDSGKPLKFTSIDSTLKALEEMIESGNSNIDVGIMQINYKWHHKEFTSLRDMVNPSNNIAYAAKFLRTLKDNHGSWQKAVRFYHSGNENFNKKYSRQVTLAWIVT